jgi:ribosomal protein S18 acetylase RimI-like enzyme
MLGALFCVVAQVHRGAFDDNPARGPPLTPNLDGELAELGYVAVRGWPDQRPVTPAMIRSLLRPGGMTATTLAMQRDRSGRLVGAAALRWPATLSASGRLWGPIVHPTARNNGVGRELLATLMEVTRSHPGVRFTTTEIPESRAEGWKLFEHLGWRKQTPSTLLARPLPARLNVSTSVPVRSVRPGEYVDKALADLFALVRPHLCPSIARDTFARWSADARYTSDGLLLAGAPDDLSGAALVYLSRHSGPDEPAEALLSDILVSPKLDPILAAEVRTALIGAALAMADGSGVEVARAVVDNPELRSSLQSMGFVEMDRIRHYVSG